MEGERIVGFAAVSQRDLLVIFLDNPRRKIVVQSAEARRLYDRPVDKRPGYVLSRDHSEGQFTMQMADGSAYAWTADVDVDDDAGDILLYNLQRMERQ